MNSESENSTGALVMIGVVIVFVLGMLLMGGCGTFYGLASDIEDGSGGIRRALKPSMERREQERLNRAAELVITERQKNNQ